MTNKEREELLKEILDLTPLKPHGRFLLAPRFGKTRLAIELVKINKPQSILWVTPLAELAQTEIPKEFETWKAKRFIKKLNTSTWASLNKLEGHFEMIILDEEQYATLNNLSSIFNGKLTFDYIITLTGTDSKYESKQNLYKELNLDVIYKMDINEAVDIGILSNYEIKVVEIEMGTEKNIKAGSKVKSFMTSEEKQYQYLDKQFITAVFQRRKDVPYKMLARMRAIYDSSSKTEAGKWLMNNLEGKKLFFCSSSKQADSICENTYHNKTDGKAFKQFLEGSIDNIAMVNKGGTGVTYRNLDHLVLVQVDSDNNGLTSQKISRALLKQDNYKAVIWILCLINTQDEKWVESVLNRFDKSKVEYIRFKNLENNQYEIK